MFSNGSLITRGVVYAPGDLFYGDDGPSTPPGGCVGNQTCVYTQVGTLIVGSIHMGLSALLQVGGGNELGPVITSVIPNSRGQGATAQTITINGSDFDPGASVTFQNPGITVEAPGAAFVNSDQMTVVIDVSPTASTGPGNVTITNPDNSTFTLTNGFTVNHAPVLTSITPTSRDRER